MSTVVLLHSAPWESHDQPQEPTFAVFNNTVKRSIYHWARPISRRSGIILKHSSSPSNWVISMKKGLSLRPMGKRPWFSPQRPFLTADIGNIERWNVVRNHIKFYNNVQASARYLFRDHCFPLVVTAGSVILFFSSLKEVLNAHPIMGVITEEEDGPDPRWSRPEQFDLGDLVTFCRCRSSFKSGSGCTVSA